MNGYIFLANVIVVVHLAIMAFVVIGLVLILVGGWRRWGWVRNFWFRTAHVAVIMIVVMETCFGIRCPLTDWEDELRIKGGQPVDYFVKGTGERVNQVADTMYTYVKDGELVPEGTEIIFSVNRQDFTGKVLSAILFIELPQWGYNLLYFGFGAAILAAFALVPPHLPRRRRAAMTASPA
jgi:hypothetical protein